MLYCYYCSYCLDTFTRCAFLYSILQLHHINFALNAKSPSRLISFNPNLKIKSTFKADPKPNFHACLQDLACPSARQISCVKSAFPRTTMSMWHACWRRGRLSAMTNLRRRKGTRRRSSLCLLPSSRSASLSQNGELAVNLLWHSLLAAHHSNSVFCYIHRLCLDSSAPPVIS